MPGSSLRPENPEKLWDVRVAGPIVPVRKTTPSGLCFPVCQARRLVQVTLAAISARDSDFNAKELQGPG